MAWLRENHPEEVPEHFPIPCDSDSESFGDSGMDEYEFHNNISNPFDPFMECTIAVPQISVHVSTLA